MSNRSTTADLVRIRKPTPWNRRLLPKFAPLTTIPARTPAISSDEYTLLLKSIRPAASVEVEDAPLENPKAPLRISANREDDHPRLQATLFKIAFPEMVSPEQPHPTRCFFLDDLPGEIRNMIYELTSSADGNTASVDIEKAAPPGQSLHLTCRRIRYETRSLYKHANRLYWPRTHFHFVRSTWYPDAPPQLPAARNLDMIRHIEFYLSGPKCDYPRLLTRLYALVNPRGIWKNKCGRTIFITPRPPRCRKTSCKDPASSSAIEKVEEASAPLSDQIQVILSEINSVDSSEMIAISRYVAHVDHMGR